MKWHRSYCTLALASQESCLRRRSERTLMNFSTFRGFFIGRGRFFPISLLRVDLESGLSSAQTQTKTARPVSCDTTQPGREAGADHALRESTTTLPHVTRVIGCDGVVGDNSAPIRKGWPHPVPPTWRPKLKTSVRAGLSGTHSILDRNTTARDIDSCGKETTFRQDAKPAICRLES